MSRTRGWLRIEPDAEVPPVRVRRDWWLAAAVAGAVTAEAVVRDDMASRPLALALGCTLALATLWRRTHPLAMVGLAFGAVLAADLASGVLDSGPVVLDTAAVVIVLVYALFRWGTSREAAAGLLVMLLAWSVSIGIDFTSITDAAGGLVALLFAAALGVSVRYRHIVRAQQLEGVRSREREELARELHDTVAHHVSAITIQAQAGRFLAASEDLSGAAAALAVIEEEASRTLAEMRSMVGSLRRSTDTSEVLPVRRVDDIENLATVEARPGLRVEVEHRGDLDGLQPSIAAALYRVAQESITNAKRHARHATRVHVRVDGDAERVRLSVSDDGARALSNVRIPGYGLVGMAERVSMLGGTLDAGPGPNGGWLVCAVIPRRGDPR